ncbi:MAG: hypothetical protein MI923_19930 [Phycisphaerales bacterium]|nr:hypothetical protein [Phycisphaerales bacterium]
MRKEHRAPAVYPYQVLEDRPAPFPSLGFRPAKPVFSAIRENSQKLRPRSTFFVLSVSKAWSAVLRPETQLEMAANGAAEREET